jgi:hypothetical protein
VSARAPSVWAARPVAPAKRKAILLAIGPLMGLEPFL